MDSFGSHLKPEVVGLHQNTCNTATLFIPPKTTSFLQPLDVCINASFKKAMREIQNKQFAEALEVFTQKGYRRKHEYQDLVNFVSEAVKRINPEIIKRFFECCGISGEVVPTCKYKNRLASIVNGELELCDNEADNTSSTSTAVVELTSENDENASINEKCEHSEESDEIEF